MSRLRTNICLNMIVKNEAKVLPRLLRSVKDYIDYYVIVDTGSTDQTIDLIQQEMSEYGIEGEVHQREWVNFGVNRQQALECGTCRTGRPGITGRTIYYRVLEFPTYHMTTVGLNRTCLVVDNDIFWI
jgi:glycosyltransferase involved in cell wall biosynthesis